MAIIPITNGRRSDLPRHPWAREIAMRKQSRIQERSPFCTETSAPIPLLPPDPCRPLLAAIMLRALADAFVGDDWDDQYEARTWLLARADGLMTCAWVCGHLHLNLEAVRTRILRACNEPREAEAIAQRIRVHSQHCASPRGLRITRGRRGKPFLRWWAETQRREQEERAAWAAVKAVLA